MGKKKKKRSLVSAISVVFAYRGSCKTFPAHDAQVRDLSLCVRNLVLRARVPRGACGPRFYENSLREVNFLLRHEQFSVLGKRTFLCCGRELFVLVDERHLAKVTGLN